MSDRPSPNAQRVLDAAEAALAKGLCVSITGEEPCDSCKDAANRIIVKRQGVLAVLSRVKQEIGE